MNEELNEFIRSVWRHNDKALEIVEEFGEYGLEKEAQRLLSLHDKKLAEKVRGMKKEHVDWRDVESRPFVDDDVAGKVRNADEQDKEIRGFNKALDLAAQVIEKRE